jgi:hypothetical protein
MNIIIHQRLKHRINHKQMENVNGIRTVSDFAYKINERRRKERIQNFIDIILQQNKEQYGAERKIQQ